MDDSPTIEQLAMELVLSLALSSVVALAFVHWARPVAYVALGFVVALVLLSRRLALRSRSPAWFSIALVPIDTLFWPTAILGDVLRAHALARTAEQARQSKPTTASSTDTDTKNGPGSHTDQNH